ncbi:MAG: nicotinate-nicotinamide nucleotide adenylyltransferase [Desulfobacteraceae bacterium]|nr:MAG: nicotinate-nicotinamide nucleotide adenylyltransferase [Desulfobacteraceae bacterium]
MKPSIGLLGGTFNPIHRGHIELGLKIREVFHLQEILYILSARPPHKKGMTVAPAELRWRMLQKALEPFPQLVPCDIEMKRPADSWTIDTVSELKSRFPGNSYYFISGSEGFLKIRTWKNYRILLHELSFIVVLRKEGHRTEVEQLLLEENITPCYEFPNPQQPGAEIPAVYLFSYCSEQLGLSSTFIRQKVKSSGFERIEHFVVEDVKKIMEENKLYEK